MSSSLPGASPTIITFASGSPEEKTKFLDPFFKSQNSYSANEFFNWSKVLLCSARLSASAIALLIFGIFCFVETELCILISSFWESSENLFKGTFPTFSSTPSSSCHFNNCKASVISIFESINRG